jgi:TonB-linked SusC/RagA family outer membrane protein
MGRSLAAELTQRDSAAVLRPLSGTVVDESGQPVVGAVVALVGANTRSTTDGAGRFRLDDVGTGDVTLRVTAIGHRPLTQPVAASETSVRLVVTRLAVNLDEIVVTGTPGEQRVRALGNAVARVDAPRVIDQAGATNVSELLTSRAPGVVLQSSSGTAGSGSRILIRGRGSMQFVGDPLIYVDGVRVNNSMASSPTPSSGGATFSRLDDIDPNDIESVEIIKGPAAATLYGTEASAGVIQIITKRGRDGKSALSLRVRQGFNTIGDQRKASGIYWGRDLQSGQEFTWSASEQLATRGTKLFRTGHAQGYDLELSGGASAVQYFVSGGYDRDEGIAPQNEASKFRSRANLSFQPRPDIDLNANVGVTTGRADTYSDTYYFAARYYIPTLRSTPGGGFIDIPPDVQAATQSYFQDLNHVTGGLQLNHRPKGWFTHRLTAGFDFTNERNVALIPFVPDQYAGYYSPAGRLGSKAIAQYQTGLTTIDYSGTLSLKVKPTVSSKTSAGLQYYRKLLKIDNLSGQAFPAPGVTALTGTTGLRSVAEDQVENTTVGLFVQQEFAWRDRLFLTAAVRADDNSAFGSDFDLVTYPKVSASWVVAENSTSAVNSLRFRAAYGESGQQPEAFAALKTYAAIAGRGDRPAGTPTFLGNPSLGPERGRELEAGFEAGLWNGRAAINLTGYLRRTKDAIVSREVAPSTGFPQRQFVNAGKVDNKGFELFLSARPIETRQLGWELALNFSRNFNKVVSIDVPGVDAIPVGFIPNFHKPGHPVASYFGKKVTSAGLDAEGHAIDVQCDNDQGGEVLCTDAPAVFLGQNFPHTQASLSSSLTLSNRLRFYALADVALGRSYFSADKAITCMLLGADEINFHPERFDPTEVATCQLAGGLGFFDSGTILRGDFAKLREISVSYTLPTRWARSIGAAQANLTLSGRNLAILWKKDRGPFALPDPEVFTDGNNYGESTHDQGVVPLPRQFLASLRITF